MRYRTRDPFMLSSEALDRIGGSSLSGTGMSALRFMDYRRCVRTVTGQQVYRFTVIRRAIADDICDECRVKHYYDDDNNLVVTLPPDYNGSVLTKLYRQHAVVKTRPSEHSIIERVSKHLLVTENDVEIKRDRADKQIDDVFEFAKAPDKHAFLFDVFSK